MISREEYKSFIPIFDEKGVRFGNLYIVEAWEKPVLERGIEEIAKRLTVKTVAEAGFGCGWSATAIMRYLKPTLYYCMEPHPILAQKAREWAIPYKSNVQIHETWLQDMENIKVDLLFDDRYEMCHVDPPKIKFDYEWYACVPLPKDQEREDGFFFEENGRTFFQMLRRK